jgi:TonB family protein
MNGHPPPTRASTGLFIALAASVVLHGAVLFVPYLGASTEALKPSPQAPKPPSPRLTAVLTAPRTSPLFRPLPLASFEPVPLDEVVIQVEDAPPAQAVEQRAGADLLPIEAPLFYPTRELSKKPQIIETNELDAPETKPIVASGSIVLKLWINDLGEVVDTEVEKTTLPEVFTRAASHAFRKMRFTPGERQGKPVGTVMRIEIRYDDGRAGASSLQAQNLPLPPPPSSALNPPRN